MSAENHLRFPFLSSILNIQANKNTLIRIVESFSLIPLPENMKLHGKHNALPE